MFFHSIDEHRQEFENSWIPCVLSICVRQVITNTETEKAKKSLHGLKQKIVRVLFGT
jgi:hypothetical protein